MHDRGYDAGQRRGPIVAGHPDQEPRYRNNQGAYDGSFYDGDVPRYGRQFGYGDGFDQGYRGEDIPDDGYARYAASGFYPSDHPFERGGYARTAYPYQRSFRGSGERYSSQGRGEGEHRGKGPRGYQRADARIEEDVNDRLSDDPNLDASDIEVSVKASEVTLSGEVACRHDKRRAEDCVESVSGVTNVQNNLRIRERQQTAQSDDLRPA